MPFSSGSIVAGPRAQFMPTTSAPASSMRLHASTTDTPSRIIPIDVSHSRIVGRVLEGLSVPGRILVCPDTKAALGTGFNFESRGPTEIKGVYFYLYMF